MPAIVARDMEARAGVALVTGGTGGIGSAVCRQLARRGSRVAFTFRGADRAAALLDELRSHGVEAEGVAVDLGDEGAVARACAGVVDRFGGVHTLVHAAGPTVAQRYLSEVPPEEYRHHLDAEVAPFFSAVTACLPALRDSRGSIVAVTTAATSRHPKRDGLSTGTKAAIDGLVRALAVEEGRFGVRVNCVGPGMLTDGMAERLMASGDLDDAALAVARRAIPLGRFGTADDVADAVCFLASDAARFVTGQKLDVDGGYGA